MKHENRPMAADHSCSMSRSSASARQAGHERLQERARRGRRRHGEGRRDHPQEGPRQERQARRRGRDRGRGRDVASAPTARAASSSRSTSRPTSPRATTTSRRSSKNVVDVAAKRARTARTSAPSRTPAAASTIEDVRQALVGKHRREHRRAPLGSRSTVDGARHACTRTCTWAARSACSSPSRRRQRRAAASAGLREVRRRHRDADRGDGPLVLDASRGARRTTRRSSGDLRGAARRGRQGAARGAWPKIIEGKLAKWMKEVCLLEQPSVLEADKTRRRRCARRSARSRRRRRRSSRSCASSAARASRSRRADFAAEVAKMAGG